MVSLVALALESVLSIIQYYKRRNVSKMEPKQSHDLDILKALICECTCVMDSSVNSTDEQNPFTYM